MNGIVSLFDETLHQQVADLWDEIEARFGLKDIAPTPIPHFSYQIAEDYDLDQLGPLLKTIAHRTQPFRVRTNGLGIFTGSTPASPVLYVPVIRSPQLSALQQVVWDETNRFSSGVSDYYSPANWVPHITLADNNINHDSLPPLIRYLSERSFSWEITVDNLAVIHDTDGGKGIYLRTNFGD